MQNQKGRLQVGVRWVRRHWVLLTAALFAAILLLAGQPLQAADAQPAINQTVPGPTPKPVVPPPSDNGGDNDNSNSSDPVATPAPATATPAAPASVEQTENSTGALTAVVNVVALNVRQGPGTTQPVIGKLAQGAEVTVLARNSAGDWWLICCIPATATNGWVSAALVTPNFSAEQAAALPVSDSAVEAAPLATTSTPTATVAALAAATPVPGGKAGVVAGVNLNVRQGAGTDNPVLGKLRAGDAVSVLGRNTAGDWLYICCVGSPAANGWVSAQFITPTFTAAELDEVTGAPVVEQPTSTPEAAAGDAAQETAAAGLSVDIVQEPPFAVQGREIALVYTIRNNGSADLADVVLSSELPGPLTLVAATAAGGTVTQQEPPLVEITWPVLAAGESATATVRVRVAEDAPNGTTFASLATVTAGGESAVNGITLGMPPALLPEFW